MVRQSQEVRLSVEEVEQRLLLAATVDVSNGQLGILGTTGNDDISIVQFADAAPVPAALRGQYAVIAKGAITVTGAPNPAITGPIAVGGGFNAVLVNESLFNEDVQVKLGDGNDTLNLGTASIAIPAGFLDTLVLPDDLRIDAGAGSDTINITNTAVLNKRDDNSGDKSTANLDIKLGSGNNKLAVTGSQIAGNVSVAGEGNSVDTVSFVGSSFGGKVALNLAAGNDQVVVVQSDFAESVQFNLGDGNDTVAFAGPTASNFGKSLSINGGAGTDAVVSVAGGNLTHVGAFSQVGIETKLV
jgi:hypothetical protein